MTKEQFIREYAQRSGISVDYLLSVKNIVPCDCGEDMCNGWAAEPKMGSEDT